MMTRGWLWALASGVGGVLAMLAFAAGALFLLNAG